MSADRISDATITGFISRFASRLRFPYLFALTAAIFVLDLLIPDIIPLADEIFFGLATLLLGSLRKKPAQQPSRPAPPPPPA